MHILKERGEKRVEAAVGRRNERREKERGRELGQESLHSQHPKPVHGSMWHGLYAWSGGKAAEVKVKRPLELFLYLEVSPFAHSLTMGVELLRAGAHGPPQSHLALLQMTSSLEGV